MLGAHEIRPMVVGICRGQVRYMRLTVQIGLVPTLPNVCSNYVSTTALIEQAGLLGLICSSPENGHGGALRDIPDVVISITSFLFLRYILFF